DAARMLEETGCDAVMIGRACLGYPWIFRQTVHYLETGRLEPEPSLQERLQLALRHLKMSVDYHGEKVAVMTMRKQLSWYLKGMPNANPVKQQIHQARSSAEVERVLQDYLQAVASEPVSTSPIS